MGGKKEPTVGHTPEETAFGKKAKSVLGTFEKAFGEKAKSFPPADLTTAGGKGRVAPNPYKPDTLPRRMAIKAHAARSRDPENRKQKTADFQES